MPPKGGWKPVPDLAWVSGEVKDKEEIAEVHRRRAAGLHSVPSHLSTVDPPKGECSARLCASNPRCYRRLGIKEVLELKQEEYVEEKLQCDAVGERNGPAGLRNLGATCYANAFLQVWYHNVAFRNGVYTAVKSATPKTPLYHLAMIFAQLGYSDRAVVDPTPLINALGLRSGDQQDAAEFAKLFTSLIASAFTAQADDNLKNLMPDMFEGKMEHRVQCLKCNFVSQRHEAFAELDLGIKNNYTVQECLQELQQPERLEGDNRYRCPRCENLQVATRSSRPVVLPPVLNLCLMRFTYTSKGRVKRKAVIRYGKEMVIGGVEYHLKAVVTHHGSSAMSGHFTCEVYDDDTEGWLQCNDEHVGPVNGNKKQKKDNPSGLASSADAYMLVYARADVVDSLPPSRAIQEMVEADNISFSTGITEMRRRKEILQDEYGHLQGAKKQVIGVLPGSDRIVYAEAMAKWLKSDTFDRLFDPWTEWPGEHLCEHKQVAPANVHRGLLISDEAFDTLSAYSQLPDLALCRTCIDDDFCQALEAKQREEMVDTFDELDNLPSDRYILPAKWLKGWRSGETRMAPTEGQDSLVCPHGGRWDEGKATSTVSTEAFHFLCALFPQPFIANLGSDPPCQKCFSEHAGKMEANREQLDQIKDENIIKQYINTSPPPFDVDHYLLPTKWVDEWTAWRKKHGPRPKLHYDLCAHGGLDWDPCMEWPSYVTERGWREIVKRYGDVEPVVIQFGSNPLPGKRTTVKSVHPAVCDECRIKRSSEFETASIVVVVGKTGKTGGDQVLGTRRARRGKASEVRVEVSKATTIKEIKLEICATYGVSPISQTLRHGGRELESDMTVGQVGILANDEVQCEVVDEEPADVTGLGVGDQEGFGGTALLGGIACGQCTFVNTGGATSCEMCEMAL